MLSPLMSLQLSPLAHTPSQSSPVQILTPQGETAQTPEAHSAAPDGLASHGSPIPLPPPQPTRANDTANTTANGMADDTHRKAAWSNADITTSVNRAFVQPPRGMKIAKRCQSLSNVVKRHWPERLCRTLALAFDFAKRERLICGRILTG
jgi:hypothetical protein